MGRLAKPTEANYYTSKLNKSYCSVSQLKQFIGVGDNLPCEAKAMAEISGEYVRPQTDALLIGSYVDTMLLEPDKIEKFEAEHPEMFSTRGDTKGQLKSTFKNAQDMVAKAKGNDYFMKTLEGGEHQKIMTGKIYGVPFKIKMDVYKEGKSIVDLKTCESIRKLYYNPLTKHKENFVQFYDYITQGAVYQEIVRQNTGETLPFFLSCISKEKEPELEVIHIDNATLNARLMLLKADIVHVGMVKKKKVKPQGCGCCEYCRRIKKLDNFIEWTDLGGDV